MATVTIAGRVRYRSWGLQEAGVRFRPRGRGGVLKNWHPLPHTNIFTIKTSQILFYSVHNKVELGIAMAVLSKCGDFVLLEICSDLSCFCIFVPFDLCPFSRLKSDFLFEIYRT